ncbi:MAG: hypothetical protein ABIJ43_05765 [Candidatus Beckwithbacteria bacterium]
MKNKIKKIIEILDNTTIGYASYIPEGSPFITLGRKIEVIRPIELVEMLQNLNDDEVDELTHVLIEILDNPNKDYAADVLLYSLTGVDAAMRQYINLEIWNNSEKKTSIPYWKGWLQKNKKKLF